MTVFSAERRQGVNIAVVVIDIEGCFDVSEQLYERSGLEHGRQGPGGGFQTALEIISSFSLPGAFALRIDSALNSSSPVAM